MLQTLGSYTKAGGGDDEVVNCQNELGYAWISR